MPTIIEVQCLAKITSGKMNSRCQRAGFYLVSESMGTSDDYLAVWGRLLAICGTTCPSCGITDRASNTSIKVIKNRKFTKLKSL